ncbi:transmembrane and coiled-coil domain-containing protein 4-like [Triticum urartu]|uniref:transmembrane and coiled-coil domain-containing protein 4-like n=1 Tax=Triticum urartu TaxID=4572 RepID=UPI0020446F48|nr:transmembrane and coiled-coil domain-containing protein 4-like [Triticum urartu]
MAAALLTPTQRYAAGALLALALRQAQIHQSVLLGSSPATAAADEEERVSSASGGGSSSSTGGSGEDAEAAAKALWTHDSRGLLRPVFRFLEIDPAAWPGLEETAASPEAKHHIGAFLRMIFQQDGESSSDSQDQEHALAKGVDAMVMSLSSDTAKDETTKEGDPQRKASTSSGMAESSEKGFPAEDLLGIDNLSLDDVPATHHRKMTLLFTLLSACVADKPVSQEEDDRKSSHFRKGYDARHRVALRLLATWLDVKWVKMEAIEVMVACSAMAAAKEQEQSGENATPKSKWAKWKRGGIIGAAALTGGALLAITGGLAAPAIAAGFGALAPTLGTIIPVIGASGFAAMATAAGSVAGSVAVAASFGAAGAGLTGTKMARRIGSVKEFEFKPIGENHNQGRLAVGILVSGFAFDEEDYIRPWEGWKDNLERYILQWESKHIIAVSTAIQDWLTSRLALELMKQGAMRTVLSGFLAAFAWPATLLAATDFIDSKWSVAIDRSDKAGKMLAEVLMKGSQGNRPVTLVGFSLGARVIFKCLQELALSSDNEGLVERVVLLGAPVSVKGEKWEPARKMVAARFVNVYSKDDWILGVTFRASLLTQGLAGIQAVDIPGVENVDVTELVDGHSSYLSAAQLILKHLELNTYYPVFVPLTAAVSK